MSKEIEVMCLILLSGYLTNWMLFKLMKGTQPEERKVVSVIGRVVLFATLVTPWGIVTLTAIALLKHILWTAARFFFNLLIKGEL